MSELKEFDAAKYLKDDEIIHHFLADAFREGDPRTIQAALGTVARARGITNLANDCGIGREDLYRALDKDSAPELATVLNIIETLCLRLTGAAPNR
jgi:probable addiction module antidote protein